MKQTTRQVGTLMALVVASTLAACGAADTAGVTATVDTPASAAAAVGALFSSPVSANLSVKVVKVAEDRPYSTCDEFLGEGASNRSQQIETSAYVAPGAYGSLNDLLNVEEGHSCADADGTENSGNGPGDEGRVAKFVLLAAVEGSCTNDDGSIDTLAMEATSTGAWRNTDEFSPQIWGHFLISYNDESYEIDCTIHLGDDETIVYADCTDESGTVVVQDTSATCQLESDDGGAQASEANDGPELEEGPDEEPLDL